MSDQENGFAGAEELSPAQRQKQFSDSQVSFASESSGYQSQSSSDSEGGKEQPPKDGIGGAEVSQTIFRIKVSVSISDSRTRPDCDSDPERFYARGPDERVLCVEGEAVCLLADTGEPDPNRQKDFVLVDEKPVNKGGIRGTKAKLHTVKGTPIGVYISDPEHPETAELKTLSGTAQDALVEAIIHEEIEAKHRTMICYPNGITWYYIVPSPDLTCITVIPDGPPTNPVPEKYMCWSHDPSWT